METLETLYKQYYKTIYSYLFGLTRNAQTAEDLTQETFLQVIKSIPSFRGDSKVTTWIYGIARNLWRKWASRNKSADVDISRIIDNFPDASEASSPEKTVLDNERNRSIRLALSSLPEHQRELIILRDWHSLPYEDIARIVNRSLPWVKVNIYRSRLAFRKIYYQMEENCND